MDINIIIVLVYFAFLIALGFVYKSATKNTKDYFAGGGRMQWWMVGATAFMTSVSAMTFTGLMGKALDSGLAITTVFFANALGYFINYKIFAARARQMRIISPMQGVRRRFGPGTEQLFTWANVPLSVLQAGVWLNALSVFVSAVLHIPMEQTVVVTGLIVLFMSIAGGSWAVITSDFLQMIILIVMSVVAAFVAIFKAGGIMPLLNAGLPASPIMGDGYDHTYLFVIWFICQFTRQFFSTNNMIDSYRYITAKDTEHARKAAILACCLTLVGACVWFIPTWYVAGHYPDPNTWGIDGLGNKVKDAAYYVFVQREMPVGMVGLIVSAMFAATMSSMDSALNRNAGIIVKSVYEPYFAKNSNEKQLIFVSKILTAVFGFMIIAVAYFLISLKSYGLFDVTMIIGSLIGFPILVPSILCFFVRKTPDWAGWATVLVGMCVSAIVAFGVTPDSVQHLLGLDEALTHREFIEMKSVTLAIIAHMSITLPFYFATKLFYKEPAKGDVRGQEVAKFYQDIDTAVISEDSPHSIQMDNEQHTLLGKMVLAGAGAISLLVLVPNPLWGRLLFILIAGIIACIGFALLRSVKKVETVTAQTSPTL